MTEEEKKELSEKVKRVFWDFAIRQAERKRLAGINESEVESEDIGKTAMPGAGRIL